MHGLQNTLGISFLLEEMGNVSFLGMLADRGESIDSVNASVGIGSIR